MVLLLVGVADRPAGMNWKLALLSMVHPAGRWPGAPSASAARSGRCTARSSRSSPSWRRRIQESVAGHPGGQGVRPRAATRSSASTTQNVDAVQVVRRGGARDRAQRAVPGLCSNASTLVMLWVGGMLVICGQLTFGELVAFYAYLLQLVQPIRRGGWLMTMGARAAAASAERIFEILDTPISVAGPPRRRRAAAAGRARSSSRTSPAPTTRAGRCSSTSASWPSPGQTIALVGATGSGKTSIANLIPRFYDVDGGQVLDRRPRRARRPASVAAPADRHRHAGDDAVLRHRSATNIAFGRPDATDAEIACGRARRARRRVHRAAAGRLRHARRGARRLALGRPEAAHRHRAGAADGPAHPDPGRVHVERRRRHGAADPRRRCSS